MINKPLADRGKIEEPKREQNTFAGAKRETGSQTPEVEDVQSVGELSKNVLKNRSEIVSKSADGDGAENRARKKPADQRVYSQGK